MIVSHPTPFILMENDSMVHESNPPEIEIIVMSALIMLVIQMVKM